MERVSIIGSAGSGKSTLAAALSARLGLPHVELDRIYHQADWVPLDNDAFHARVAERIAGPRWVTDGNYTSHGIARRIWQRADTIIWLDLPRHVIMRQLIARSVRRVLTSERLWNGNRESIRNLLHPDPEQNVIAWSFTRFHPVRERYAAMANDGTWEGLRVVRLCSRSQVTAFVESLP